MYQNEASFLKHIHRLWHDVAANGKIEVLMHLYHEDATLISPLVPILLKQQSPIIQGYNEIYFFFRKRHTAKAIRFDTPEAIRLFVSKK